MTVLSIISQSTLQKRKKMYKKIEKMLRRLRCTGDGGQNLGFSQYIYEDQRIAEMSNKESLLLYCKYLRVFK